MPSQSLVRIGEVLWEGEGEGGRERGTEGGREGEREGGTEGEGQESRGKGVRKREERRRVMYRAFEDSYLNNF